ncbi:MULTISPECIES: penicillin-binding protein 1A [unclassified Massilia]|uniref:penicillin-binding protein 1A n=1 Tax=unclassified Massilia TaxID=2609279 RepID=UPI00177CAEC4|nr:MULTISPECIES: PBP1A family penicillin-binding protein [unclassified Massilia]MBD8529446.1 PBP1A family penicillin-binding protein [Massilia sp. CFBP 13647]MBD8672839.1 PBP1A family penicillin-binding protein [Massilia sp. CFBP 13721]
MRLPRQQRGFIFFILAAIVFAIAAVAVWFLMSIVPNVPSIDAVTDYKPKIPLRIYTADKVLIGEFGEEHRDFVPIDQVPPMMKKAVLAIEDARFYEHKGIDWMGAARALKANVTGGFGSGGASTITMQVARNFFLSREKVLSRKLNEIVLAYKIEDALTKDQILELYMNQIYLGQRSYGFASAARSYFGKKLDQLTIAETAMLAGLPQNPARHNPAVNPKRAKLRQEQVLRRLRDLGDIDEAQYAKAVAEPLRVHSKPQEFGTHAQYVAELARQVVFAQYAEASYTRGIRVYTTIDSKAQEAAYDSVRRNVLAYDSRHGYRGPEAHVELPASEEEREEAIVEALQKRPSSDGLEPAVVLAASSKSVKVETIDGDTITITGAGLKFAAAGLSSKAKEAQRIESGAVVRISKIKDSWGITQVPLVAAAFVALDADSGAYQALVGGFDYNLQKFNHVTQAWRQPGSAIKPFVYSAALEKGYNPGTLILDQELVMPGENAGADWKPQNDDNVFDGPITMRYSLAHSKNVPTVRLLRALEVPYTHDFLGKFGFDLARHPKNLTLALGTGAVTPLQMAGAYAVFANGGYGVKPYLIARVEDGDGTVLIENKAPAPRQEAARVLDPRNAWVTDSMLRDVTRYGTGAAATKRLARPDIAGKTGTTSDAFDGWFAGYGGNVVAVAWMGYDEPRSLGGREFGATLALPIWLDYMQVALAKRPVVERPEPQGVLRENDDWIYAEFAEMPQFRAIDIDPAALAAPEPYLTDDEDGGEVHPRADGAALPQPAGAPVFVPAQ